MDLVLVGSDCYIKAHCFIGVQRVKEFKVSKWFICSVLDREMRELKYLSGSQYFPSY